jgi:hypothetical protein
MPAPYSGTCQQVNPEETSRLTHTEKMSIKGHNNLQKRRLLNGSGKDKYEKN